MCGGSHIRVAREMGRENEGVGGGGKGEGRGKGKGVKKNACPNQLNPQISYA